MSDDVGKDRQPVEWDERGPRRKPLEWKEHSRIIELLLRKQFPFSWAPPPISSIGSRTPHDPQAHELHRKRMESIEAERKRLSELPQYMVLDMYDEWQAEVRAAEKAKRDADMAKLEALFHSPELEADFDFWTKAEYWTFDEAVALLLGKEPKKLPLLLASSDMKQTPFAQRYFRLHELAGRAQAMTGSKRLRPADVVLWGNRTGAVDEIPEPLHKVLERLKTEPAMPTTPNPLPEPNRVRQFERPNWNKWKFMPKCELWKAVCLSLDIDPREDYFAYGVKITKRFPNAPQELSDRLEVLFANLSTNGPVRPQPPYYSGMLRDPSAPVLLSEVAAFAAKCGWPIPAEMQALQQQPAVSVPAPQPTPAPTPGPVGTAVKWTDERLAELKAFREKHGTKKAAAEFQISEQRVRELLPKEKPAPKGHSVFNRLK